MGRYAKLKTANVRFLPITAGALTVVYDPERTIARRNGSRRSGVVDPCQQHSHFVLAEFQALRRESHVFYKETTMYESAEQFVALNRANSARFVGIALESAGRLFELQLKTAKNAVADLAQQINTLNDVKDPQEIAQLKTTFVPAIMEKATSYVKSVYDIAAATQSEINRLFEAQMGQLNKQVMTSLDKAVKSGPAGSEATIAAVKSAITVVNSAYDNLSKSAKQIAELAEANVEAVTAQTPHATRKKTA